MPRRLGPGQGKGPYDREKMEWTMGSPYEYMSFTEVSRDFCSPWISWVHPYKWITTWKAVGALFLRQ